MIKPSKNWNAALKRMQRMPKVVADTMRAGTKAHAEGVRITIVEGLAKGNLVTPRLSTATHAIRRALDQSKSSSVFMGEKGDMGNSLAVIKQINGWTLEPRGFAMSKTPGLKKTKISWARLWAIHENGAIIPVTEKLRNTFRFIFGINLKATTTHIVIPARHPIAKGLNRYLRSEQKKKVNRAILDRIEANMINTRAR